MTTMSTIGIVVIILLLVLILGMQIQLTSLSRDMEDLKENIKKILHKL